MKIPAVTQPRIGVAGAEESFPVHRIYCIGQNYAAHAREMGAEPNCASPLWFMKPPDAVVPGGGVIAYPPRTRNLHHEIELVVAIGTGGFRIDAADVPDHVFGYAVGIDLTRRDLQAEAKKSGRPWDTAKGFDESAPVSALRPASDVGHPSRGRIWLAVNDGLRQEGDIADMLLGACEAIADLSTLFRLQGGDLVFTGTPEGVGPLEPGDRVTGGVEGVGEIEVRIAPPRGA